MNSKQPQPSFRHRAAALLDQQMWCFGRDIVRSKWNILLDLGMCRYRSPNPNTGSTLYTAAVEPGGSLFLWGFGAMYAEPNLGGVFVRRYGFAPRLTDRESAVGVFEPSQLGRLTGPSTVQDQRRMRTLLPRLAGWFAEYEHWIAETHGTTYREESLASRSKANVAPARDMARNWERVAKNCKRYRESGDATADPWKRFLHQLRSAALPVCNAIPRPSTRVKS